MPESNEEYTDEQRWIDDDARREFEADRIATKEHVKELAERKPRPIGKAEKIGQLNISPDLLRELMAPQPARK